MKTHIYNTVNCGVYFVNGDTGIFIDGLFDGRVYGYSKTEDKVLKACIEKTEPFNNLKALIFTHKHFDHFNEEMVKQVTEKNKDILVYAPEYQKSTIQTTIIRIGVEFFQIGPFEIYAIKTIHDGDAALRAEPHVSFVINTDEETFFFAGDALFREGEAEKVDGYCVNWVDIAFINPYHTMHGGNRTFLRKLDPMKVALIHRSFEEDDTYNMHKLFEIAKKHYPEDLPEMIEPDYDSWIQ